MPGHDQDGGYVGQSPPARAGTEDSPGKADRVVRPVGSGERLGCSGKRRHLRIQADERDEVLIGSACPIGARGVGQACVNLVQDLGPRWRVRAASGIRGVSQGNCPPPQVADGVCQAQGLPGIAGIGEGV